MSNRAIRRGYADFGEGQIHYRMMDGPGRPLVMLHQTASSSACFEAMMRRMAGTRPMLALDTPGFGGSFDPPFAPQLEHYAGWLLHAIYALDIGAFDLLGHHTGAAIALQMAAEAPRRVASLLLIGAPCLTPEERADYATRYTFNLPPDESGNYLGDIWRSLRGIGATLETSVMHREMVDALRASTTRADASRAVWAGDHVALYGLSSCPLLLATSPGDVMAHCIDRIVALRPDAVICKVGGGNFAPDVDPDGCCQAVSDFLARLGAGRPA
jgi:pimeloyl-ACP methyl ester carboxylesterase